MRHTTSIVLTIGVLALTIVTTVFLYRQGIDRAGAWAGIIGIVLAAVSIYLTWPSVRDRLWPRVELIKPHQKTPIESRGIQTDFQPSRPDTLTYEQITNLHALVGRARARYDIAEASRFLIDMALLKDPIDREPAISLYLDAANIEEAAVDHKNDDNVRRELNKILSDVEICADNLLSSLVSEIRDRTSISPIGETFGLVA